MEKLGIQAGSGTCSSPLPESLDVGRHPLARKAPKAWIFCLVGLNGGLLGGLLGIGSGLFIAPLLLLIGALRPSQVSGTTLAAVLMISIVGSGAYASLGHLDFGLAWPIVAGSVLGSVAGALMSKRLSARLMAVMFLLILPYLAAKELWPSLPAPVIAASLAPLGLLGLATGFLGGLLGISAASMVVPSLVGFFLFDHHVAQGIAISVALAGSVAGAATHARQRNIDYRMLFYLAGPSCLGAVAGAFLSDFLSGQVLRILFGAFMASVVVVVLMRLVKGSIGKAADSPAGQSVGAEQPRTVGPSGNGAGLWARPQTSSRWSQIGRAGLRTGKVMNPRNIMNAMLVFIPLAIMGERLDFGPVFVFTCSALSCVPLSHRLGQATESLGTRLGPVSGGLLNATFGNAAELIISTVALSHGLFIIVRTSLIGSILGQLLLVLGTSPLLAGLKYKNLGFNRTLVQTNFTLIALALVAIGLPTVLLRTAPEKAQASTAYLTPVLCVLLLVIYGFTVVFSLRRQPAEEHDGGGPRWSLIIGLLVLAISTGGMILISELLVGTVVPLVEATDISQVFIGLILIPIFGNVVDHIVAITVALKNRMDLSLTISVGSAAQVACMVIPVIVLISLAMGQPLGLIFAPVELIALAAGLFLMVPVLLDGDSNWLEGAQLLTCYLVLALVLWAL